MTLASEQSTWQRLRRRRSVRFALWFIALCVLVAVFAYPLSPDSSPNANRMIVELGARPPGFGKYFLHLPRNGEFDKKSFWSALFTGSEPKDQLIPINHILFRADSFAVVHFIDEGLSDTILYRNRALLPVSEWLRPINEQREEIGKRYISYHRFYLGTDRYGRDILSRLLIGTRVSLGVGVVAVLISLSIGVFLGAVAGYYRGRVDQVVMYVVNLLWAIPTLLLVFAITLTLGKGFMQIFIAIGLTMWVSTARLIRGQVLVLREMDFIRAAQVLGLSDLRIIFHHIMPHIAGPLMVIAASNFATAILIEAGLSFLGIGVQPPMPSWGLMIKEHYNFLVTNRPALSLIPGIAILLLVYAFNILGNALRDMLDVRER